MTSNTHLYNNNKLISFLSTIGMGFGPPDNPWFRLSETPADLVAIIETGLASNVLTTDYN